MQARDSQPVDASNLILDVVLHTDVEAVVGAVAVFVLLILGYVEAAVARNEALGGLGVGYPRGRGG